MRSSRELSNCITILWDTLLPSSGGRCREILPTSDIGSFHHVNRALPKNKLVLMPIIHTPFSCNKTFNPGFNLKISDIRYNAPQIKDGFWQHVTCNNLFTNAFTRLSTTSAFIDLKRRFRNIVCLEPCDNPGSRSFLLMENIHVKTVVTNWYQQN